MYDIIKSKPISIVIAALLTAIWLEIYLYFLFPPNHINAIINSLWNFGNGNEIDSLIVSQFIVEHKMQQITALTFFDCILLYFIKKTNMSSWWKNTLFLTSFGIGIIICYITATLPRIEDDIKYIEYIVSDQTVVRLIQLFFVIMTLNKICIYLPSFVKISTTPRTEG